MPERTDDGRHAPAQREQRGTVEVLIVLCGFAVVILMVLALLGLHDRWPKCEPGTPGLRIGGVLMGNAAIAFVDAHPFKLFDLHKKPSMLLGMESLRGFERVSVDFASKKIKFLLPPKDSPGPADTPHQTAMGAP